MNDLPKTNVLYQKRLNKYFMNDWRFLKNFNTLFKGVTFYLSMIKIILYGALGTEVGGAQTSYFKNKKNLIMIEL